MKKNLNRAPLKVQHAGGFTEGDGPFIIVLAVYLASTVVAVAGLAIALSL